MNGFRIQGTTYEGAEKGYKASFAYVHSERGTDKRIEDWVKTTKNDGEEDNDEES